MSWSGFNVFGDRKSIDAVKALAETSGNAEIFRRRITDDGQRHAAEIKRLQEINAEMLVAIGEIARGRPDCGRPISSEKARQMARGVLTAHGLSWPSRAEAR